MTAHVLLANGWFEVLAPALGVILWVIYQVVSAQQEAKPRQQRPAPVPPQRDDEAQDPEAAAARRAAIEQQAELRAEIERFYRQARGEAPEPAEVAASVEAPARRAIDPFEEPSRKPRKDRQAPSRPRTQKKPVESSAAPQAAAPPKPVPAERLGAEVALADDRLDARLHERFDHQVGRLSGEQPDAVAAGDAALPASAAARVRAILASPRGVREALVLNEVLRRPADRW